MIELKKISSGGGLEFQITLDVQIIWAANPPLIEKCFRMKYFPRQRGIMISLLFKLFQV